jgi:anti-sigma factor RsiW
VVAAWVTDDLEPSDAERFEQHYFACDRCARHVERMQDVVERLGAALPMVLTPERLERFVADPAHAAAVVNPNERATLAIGPNHPDIVWLLRADLAGAVRVDVDARATDGTQVLELKDVPFDRERGEVALACQYHYRLVMPLEGDMVTQVTAVDAEGRKRVTRYFLDHRFDPT